MNKLFRTFIQDSIKKRRFQMKILKITSVVLFFALIATSCMKSKVKPCTRGEHKQETVSDTNTDEAEAKSSERTTAVQPGKIVYVVSSGDDDRDGGDKKQRKSTGK